MAKFHVELDGAVASGALVLKEGEPQVDITSLSLHLDSRTHAQVITFDRARFMDGILWQSTEAGVITKLTITAEYQEVQ